MGTIKADKTGEGFILLAREIYKNSKTWQALTPIQKVIMITLLLMANHKDCKWWDEYKKEFVTVKRGQLITSLEGIRLACGKGVSIQNIRTCLVNLEKMQFLTNKSTKHYRLITINKYNDYQNADNYYLTKQSTNDQQSLNKALTINKNDKNDKNDNSDLYICASNAAHESTNTPNGGVEAEKVTATLEKEPKSGPRSPFTSKRQEQLFDMFWAQYPKRRSKGQAEKTWVKIKPNEQLFRAIMDGLERAKTSVDWQKNNGQYIPYPSTWLNAKGWEDEYEPVHHATSNVTRLPRAFESIRRFAEQEG